PDADIAPVPVGHLDLLDAPDHVLRMVARAGEGSGETQLAEPVNQVTPTDRAVCRHSYANSKAIPTPSITGRGSFLLRLRVIQPSSASRNSPSRSFWLLASAHTPGNSGISA